MRNVTRNVQMHIIIISVISHDLNSIYFFLYFKFIDNSQFPQFSSNYMYMQGNLQPSSPSFENECQNNDDSLNMK
jgi:hypothetical protein